MFRHIRILVEWLGDPKEFNFSTEWGSQASPRRLKAIQQVTNLIALSQFFTTVKLR